MIPDRSSRIRAERLVLQALCQGTREGSIRDTANILLRNYHWQEPLHGVIYEVLLTIPSTSPTVIRDQLPSRLTRKGFPDVPWEELFEQHDLAKDEAERLMQDLSVACPD